MKKQHYIITTILLFASTVLFTGCKKDDNGPSEKGLAFHIHSLVGNQEASYGVEYTKNGRKFNLTDFRYYISNIVLIKEDGSQYPLTNKVLLVHPSQNEYELGNVPVGVYKGFKFMLGIDSATNHSDPTTYPAGDPLAIQTNSIHWSWSSGYIFFKAEGYVDSTASATGPADLEFFYHVGMDGFSRTIDFSTSAFEVTGANDYELGITFDFLKVLNNVDMRTENATHTMDNMPLAVKVADNWQGAFELE